MIRNISLWCIGIIISAALLSSVSSVPNSSDSVIDRMIRCITETIFPPNSRANLPRIPVTGSHTRADELPARISLNLNESAIALLARLANLRLQNLAGYQQALRKTPTLQERISFPEEKGAQDSPLFRTTLQRQRFRGAEVLDQNTAVAVQEKSDSERRIFHCHPIEDVYIPAVDKMVPAYVCKLESRQFIISSERFLEDYKYHLNVTVDETTFQRLSTPNKASDGNSMASVIPVTLTQRQGDEFYGVKRTQN